MNAAQTATSALTAEAACRLPLRGLSPFLRLSIAGEDLRPVGQALLSRAQAENAPADDLLALSYAMLAMQLEAAGLEIQAQALASQRVYEIPALQQPARLTLLVLMLPGPLSANTPIECLLENSDIDIVFYYLQPTGDPFADPLPEHDVALLAISEDERHRPVLEALQGLEALWPRPLLNRPGAIPATGREVASRLLQHVPGLLIPPTWTFSRAAALQLATTLASPSADADHETPAATLPIIIRPLGSHGGHDLEKIDNAAQLALYLQKVVVAEYFISPFVDYRSADGQYRKFRIALIDGQPYACHMGISSHWMIHYVNAGMYEDAAKRAEELAFMEGFADFAARHAEALAAIHQRSGLDYVCVDCAETATGELLIFEIDHAMIVHAMDVEALFPYKQIHMKKVRDAFRDLLLATQALGQPPRRPEESRP